jgi:hypothetical protein
MGFQMSRINRFVALRLPNGEIRRHWRAEGRNFESVCSFEGRCRTAFRNGLLALSGLELSRTDVHKELAVVVPD